jgi:DNA-binding CsgD family transcriptional regulator
MHRLYAARPGPGLIDVAIAIAVLVASLVMLAHGGVPGSDSHPGSGDLDLAGGLLAAGASLPLVAWRRSALGVFALTAAATALLGGLGYEVGVPLGPSVALFLLVASRHEADPWTPRTKATVLALFGAYLGATALAQSGVPGTELFHTALASGAAWFAGERARLRREHMAELRDRARRAERDAERDRRLAVLTEQERTVLRLIGEGLTNRQIGTRMGLAEKTVKNYTSHLLAKLGLERRTQAAILATELRDRPD